jgi:DNA-binding LacI/PurR family transcriptional regulator
MHTANEYIADMVEEDKLSAPNLGGKCRAVYDALRSDVDRGVFRPGDRLPGIRDLSTRFAVSSMVVRRAVSSLAASGTVDVRHGSGIYVRDDVKLMSPGSALVSLMYLFDGEELTTTQRDLLERGFLLCVYLQNVHRWDPAAEAKFFERVRSERHRALLAFCSPLAPNQDDAELVACERAGVRVIHIEHYRTELPRQEYILPDYRAAGRMAAVELMLAGYPRVMLLQSSPQAPFSQLFAEGFAAALNEHGGGYDAERDRLVLGPAFHENEESRQILVSRVREAGRIGFACVHTRIARDLYMILAQICPDRATPETVGTIGLSPISSGSEPEGIDRIEFDRAAILRRAIDVATGPRGEPLRVMMPPGLTRQGSVCYRRAVEHPL